MLFRIVLLAIAAIGLLVAWRQFALARALARAQAPRLRQQASHKLLDDGERARAATLALRDQAMAEALQLKESMRPLLESAATDVTVAAAIDGVIRQLAAEVELRERITVALAEHPEEKRAAAEARTRAQLAGAGEGDAAVSLREILHALEREQDQIAGLLTRNETLTASIDKAVVDLREARLALLDAAASPAGVCGSAELVGARLKSATDGLAGLSEAHDEITAFLDVKRGGS